MLLTIEGTFSGDGLANSGLQLREGSGLAVHIEQGRLVGPNSLPLFIPPSLIANSDFFGNAANGLHLRAGAASLTSYGAAIEGVVANNVLDNNGFPSFPGPNLPSWELLVEVGDANNAAAVFSQVAVTQNTMFHQDAPLKPLSNFLATATNFFGTGHQLSAFLGNLGLQSSFIQGVGVFQGFLAPFAPVTITDNCGQFDNLTLFAAGNQGNNAILPAIQSFAVAPGGHWVNPTARNYALLANSGGVQNPAMDRAPAGIIGQQALDKRGLPRNVDNQAVANGGISDCGANEN